MYIAKFDTILDNALDDFYEKVASTNKLKEILNTTNFDTKRKELTKILISYLDKLNFSEFDKSIDSQIQKNLSNIIRKYVAYYLFILIGFHSDKMNIFKDNMLSFSNAWNKEDFDIPNFFMSESNANIFNLTELSLCAEDMLEKKSSRSIKYPASQCDISQKLVDDLREQKVVSKNKLLQSHKIIKFVIIQNLYNLTDRVDVAKMLETSHLEEAESIYIDIVVPTEKHLDLIDIESMLSQEEISQGYARNIYDIISKGEFVYQQRLAQTTETKILDLINGGFLIPITEEFMLYNKDSEKYGTHSEEESKSKDSHDKTKRERTKIRFILEKINSVENYYSEKNSETHRKIENNLYVPLASRFAVAYNEFEDIRIMTKLLQSKSVENVENINEMWNYRQSPYVNFKDFKKNGFPILFDQTRSAIRSISFEKDGTMRQTPHSLVQLRTGSHDQQINIVGFAVNTSRLPLDCAKVRNLSLVSNGYDDFLGHLQNIILQGKQELVGWIFDLPKDTTEITTYEQKEQSEKYKSICANLRDDVVSLVCQKINQILSRHQEISFFRAFRIIKFVISQTLNIQETEPKYIELLKLIFQKLYEKYIPKYDAKDDLIFGLTGETLKLPNIPKAIKEPSMKIHLTRDKALLTEDTGRELKNAVCHHYIVWENVTILEKEKSQKYSDVVYDFMQKYAILNEDSEYVCKSCGGLLVNVKKYVAEGSYDASTQKFVSFNIPMEVSLEDLPEYKKYNTSIRNIDRLIDKISIIVNIPFLVGSSLTQRIRRSSIVKDAIDLILINNSLLGKNLKDRNERATKLYGINRELSNLFYFVLDNSIFTYTSKEKDYYKYIKHNNIVSYIIFLILLELNESHIAYMSNDKVCNYNSFAKFGEKMLNGLKIKINNAGDTKNISEYPVLSYLIYVITCMISKYTIWMTSSEIEEKQVGTKKINPLKQKIMIQTIVDLINCVMDYAETNKDKHIYEVAYTKFYQKLPEIYSSHEILDKLKDENIKNLPKYLKSVAPDLVKPVVLEKPFENATFDTVVYPTQEPMRFYAHNLDLVENILGITNQYYCPDGRIHRWTDDEHKEYHWTDDKKSLKCLLCDTVLDKNKYDEALTKKIKVNEKILYLKKISNRYCPDGKMHRFADEISEKTNSTNKVCQLCHYILDHYPSKETMEETEVVVFRPKIIPMKQEDVKENKKMIYVNNLIKKLKEEYSETKTLQDSYDKFIEKFVNLLQQNVGNTVQIENNKINLLDDTYTINHNHLGFPLEPPIIVSSSDNLINFKKNNVFFKKDVIVYSTSKPTKLEVFYDMYNHILLGYKELNKDYVSSPKSENRIRIEYSLLNKIKYSGHEHYYVDVSQFDKEKSSDIIGTISRKRIGNLKNIVYKFLVYLNQIKTKMQTDLPQDSSDDEMDIPIPIMDIKKYYQKLDGMVTRDEKYRLFKSWKLVIENLSDSEIKKKNISSDKFISLDEMHNYDYSGNLTLFYLISELTNLYNLNQSKNLRQNLVNFVIEFFDRIFNEYNKDSLNYINEIQRFMCVLNSSEYFRELDDIRDEYTTSTGDFKDPNATLTKEEIEAMNEDEAEAEGFDMDGDVNDEKNYNEAYTDRTLRRDPPLKWEFKIHDPFEEK